MAYPTLSSLTCVGFTQVSRDTNREHQKVVEPDSMEDTYALKLYEVFRGPEAIHIVVCLRHSRKGRHGRGSYDWM